MVRICSLVVLLLGTYLTSPALAQVAADVDVVAILGASNLALPRGALLLADDGNFYGTTSQGGASVGGTVFRMTPAGVVTVLHSFSANVDGWAPSAHLIQGSDRKLYGVTAGGVGGPHDGGTVFRIALDGTFEHLHSFNPALEGRFPSGGVIQASDGNYYGTTQSAIFKITPGGAFSLLLPPGGAPPPNGFTTISGLVEGTDGRLYGNANTIFAIDLAGNFTPLHVPTSGDGVSHGGELIQASDGAFYGTARAGGAFQGTAAPCNPSNCGTVFKYDLITDVYTVLFSFSGGANGQEPHAGLVEATDGFLYGTTAGGGAGFGTIFRISKTGALTTLHAFDGVQGRGPIAELIETSPDVFYGTTLFGGSSGTPGVVFRMTILRSNLKVTSLKASPAAAAGGPLKVTDTTANTGSGGSGATTTRLWLSQDANLSGGDFALGGRAIGALADGAQSKGSTTVTLPNVAPGSYFVLAEADGDEDEAETDETDNVRSKKLVIGPDLTTKSMVLSPPAPSSTSPTTVTVTVKNAGGATADASVVRLYRSSNGSVGPGDSLLGEIAFPSIAAGAQNTQFVQVTFAAGSFYLLAIADGGGAVPEANEGNNLKKVKLNVP